MIYKYIIYLYVYNATIKVIKFKIYYNINGNNSKTINLEFLYQVLKCAIYFNWLNFNKNKAKK